MTKVHTNIQTIPPHLPNYDNIINAENIINNGCRQHLACTPTPVVSALIPSNPDPKSTPPSYETNLSRHEEQVRINSTQGIPTDLVVKHNDVIFIPPSIAANVARLNGWDGKTDYDKYLLESSALMLRRNQGMAPSPSATISLHQCKSKNVNTYDEVKALKLPKRVIKHAGGWRKNIYGEGSRKNINMSEEERAAKQSGKKRKRTVRSGLAKGIPAERFGPWLCNLKEEWSAKRAARKLRLDNEEFSPLLLPDAIIDDDFQDALDVLEEPDTFELDLALIDEDYGMSLSLDERSKPLDMLPRSSETSNIARQGSESSFDFIDKDDTCCAAEDFVVSLPESMATEDFINSLPEYTEEKLEQYIDCSKSITDPGLLLDLEPLPVQYVPSTQKLLRKRVQAERKAEKARLLAEEQAKEKAEKAKSEVMRVMDALVLDIVKVVEDGQLPTSILATKEKTRERNRLHADVSREREKQRNQDCETLLNALRQEQLNFIRLVKANKTSQDDNDSTEVEEFMKRESLEDIPKVNTHISESKIGIPLPENGAPLDVRNRINARRYRKKKNIMTERVKAMINQLERENTLLLEYANKSSSKECEQKKQVQPQQKQPDTRLLPKESTTILENWFNSNIRHPFPNEEQKQELEKETGLSQKKIKSWFTNKRRRSPEWQKLKLEEEKVKKRKLEVPTWKLLIAAGNTDQYCNSY